MRSWPALVVLPVALSACPALLSDWTLESRAGDASADGSRPEGPPSRSPPGVSGADASRNGADSGGAAPEAGEMIGDSEADSALSGWQVVEVSFSASSPPTCGSAWSGSSALLYDGLNAPAATCGCTCGAPSGITCTTQIFPMCGTTSQLMQSGACVSGNEAGSTAAIESEGTPSGGSCSPQPSKTVPQATWTEQARYCAPSSSTPLNLDLGFRLCVAQAGDASTCPSDYSDQHVEYGGFADSRDCSATCTCGAPSGPMTCGDAVYECSDATCSTCTVQSSLGCFGLGTGAQAMEYLTYSPSPSGGSCAASSVSSTGSATPTGPVMLCCQ